MAVTVTPSELKEMGYRKEGDKLVRAKFDASQTVAVQLRNQPHYVLGDKSPYRSKAEAHYAGRLHVLQRAGDILEWSYEAVTLRLADRVREDARVKLQVAATMYPEYRFVLAQLRKGSWSLTPVRAL